MCAHSALALWHGRPIAEVAHDVTDRLDADIAGRLFLIPSSMQPGEITRVLREGYDAQRLTTGIRELVDALDLDVLFIDTHPGLNEETLLSLVISHVLLIVMRPDRQAHMFELTALLPTTKRGVDMSPADQQRAWAPDMSDPRHLVVDAKWWGEPGRLADLTTRFKRWMLT